jgi:hypothetical protein
MFSDRDKLIALAIVHIFETSKPFGDYSAVAILNDGAGISYGINQFTHRSGSLFQVIQAYLSQNPATGIDAITRALPLLKLTTGEAIRQCSINAALKQALVLAGQTPEMRAAQQKVMTERYLTPAIEACDGSNFTLPLSLAVIYDSINHGSYEMIRDRVAIDRGEHPNAVDFEQAWIEDYCHERLAWIKSAHGDLRNTTYRPLTFIEQIEAGNWSLVLPIRVRLGRGFVALTEKIISNSMAAPVVQPTTSHSESDIPTNSTLKSAEIGQPSTNSTQTVVQQRVSLTAKIAAASTFLTGLGINAGTLIQQKLTEMTPLQIGYLALALGLCFLAVWWYRRERIAATQQTNLLIEKAADPTQNTVELQK